MSDPHPEAAVIEYDPPHPSGRDRRGVLLSHLRSHPSLSWSHLTGALSHVYVALNPNVVRFRMPFRLRPTFYQREQQQLESQFASTFPDARPAYFRFFENAQGYRHIDVETGYDNVRAVEIVDAASGWSVGGVALGEPLFVGLPCSDLLFPVKLDNVPREDLEAFVDGLPQFFEQFTEVENKVVDVWSIEGKVSMKNSFRDTDKTTTWLYTGSIVVVIQFTSFTGRLYDLVHDWPGWVLWRQRLLIYLHYPGRFDYCQYCKFHAQSIVEGDEEERHTIGECEKLVCSRCGVKGHSEGYCKYVGGGRDGGRWKKDERQEVEEGGKKVSDGLKYSQYFDTPMSRKQGLERARAMISKALREDREAESGVEDGRVEQQEGNQKVKQEGHRDEQHSDQLERGQGHNEKEEHEKQEEQKAYCDGWQSEEEPELEMDIPGTFPSSSSSHPQSPITM